VELAVSWFPADEWTQAIHRWPRLLDDLPADHIEYSHATEARIKRLARHLAGNRLHVAPITVDGLVAHATASGSDPGTGEARSAYAAELLRTGAAVVWPTGAERSRLVWLRRQVQEVLRPGSRRVRGSSVSAPPGPERRHSRRDDAGTLRLRVDLEAAIPAVWRRIEVASDLGLDDLHDVLQAVFGWEDRDLYRFTTGPEQDPGAEFVCGADLRGRWEDDPTLPTWNVRIDELLAEAGDQLYYQYDHGDNWWHVIEVEEVIAGRVPRGGAVLREGEGAGPPEDCGGVHGYQMIVAASDGTHPDHDEAREELASWWGVEISSGDLGLLPFDAAAITADTQVGEVDAAGRSANSSPLRRPLERKPTSGPGRPSDHAPLLVSLR
jgi:hypothetical protein